MNRLSGLLCKSAPQPSIRVVGYPKSRNTRVNYMLSCCLNLPYYDFDQRPTVRPREDWIRALTGGRNAWRRADPFQSVQKTHKLACRVPRRGGLVVYVNRDPRDIFVSYMHFMRTRSAGWPGRIRFFLLGLLGREGQIRWVVRGIQRHRRSWAVHLHLVVNYERMFEDCAAYLGTCLESLDLPVDEHVVRDACEAFSFRRMSGGRDPGQEDRSSFMRKGIAGDWKHHLSTNEQMLFEPLLASDLFGQLSRCRQ